jgi:hypothetical protein
MFSKRISRGNNKYIGVEMVYSLGNYGGKRGYYLSVYPFEIEIIGGYEMIVRDILAGKKYILKEVSRKSKKAEAEAEVMAIEKFNELAKLYA